MTAPRQVNFTVSRTPAGYAIAAQIAPDTARLLRDRIATAGKAHKVLFDLVGGALIAGAAVTYPTERQIKAL